MSNHMGTIKIVRVRWHAGQPPSPLGCRWCGHPPYAHDAASLPHRPGHLWEQPTPAQVRTRMVARRRLGLCGRLPAPAPVTGHVTPNPLTTVPLRAQAHPAPGSPTGRGRHARPPVMAVPPHRQESPPGVRPWTGRRESYRRGVQV
ncbi:hypothetical protein [Streptosporangium sp. NPDC023615]|uniref:hypothetical protein n=1 Tax=Streptosporangium sp. NPDC023615 TaxID=3154794 RepID=UPI003417A821